MRAIINKIRLWLGIACPECYGRLRDVPGWDRSECEKCGKTYKWDV